MGSHKMTTVLLLLLHLLPFSQSAPEPDTHLHVYLPPEGGQGETPNIGGGLAANKWEHCSFWRRGGSRCFNHTIHFKIGCPCATHDDCPEACYLGRPQPTCGVWQ